MQQRLEEMQKFQSTPSARRATITAPAKEGEQEISIHALREESDVTDDDREARSWNFNPRPPRGERLSVLGRASDLLLFQSTPSARRATDGLIFFICFTMHFNPRPPRGERPGAITAAVQCTLFQSTPSARRATQLANIEDEREEISIHALREESDCRFRVCLLPQFRISIHALREESDWRAWRPRAQKERFQSTPSARRATGGSTSDLIGLADFNPRPPRGERRADQGRPQGPV